MCCFSFFFLMILRPPRSTRTDTLLPYTTLFRSDAPDCRGPAPEPICGPRPDAGWLIRDCPAHRCAAGQFRWTAAQPRFRSEEHTSELQSLMRISYAVFCLKNQKQQSTMHTSQQTNIAPAQYKTH